MYRNLVLVRLAVALVVALAGLTASPTRRRSATRGRPGRARACTSCWSAATRNTARKKALPQLAKILAQRQGFNCTVLFAIDPADGSINPNVRDNIPG